MTKVLSRVANSNILTLHGYDSSHLEFQRLGRLRQEDCCEFEASLDCTVSYKRASAKE